MLCLGVVFDWLLDVFEPPRAGGICLLSVCLYYDNIESKEHK